MGHIDMVFLRGLQQGNENNLQAKDKARGRMVK